MTRFLYNGVDVFSGICPSPLFSRNAEMIPAGERWGEKQVITLRGLITGQCDVYTGIIHKKRSILSGFAVDFLNLEIEEDDVIIETFDAVRLDGIDFPDSTFATPTVPFTVTLSCYPSGYFSGQWGVLSPSNTLSFSEGEGGITTITQEVSAKGFPTTGGNNNALTNARSWVATQTGWSSQVATMLISCVDSGGCLRTISENIDRLNGTYGVKLTYLSDRYGDAGSGLLRYTTEYASGIDDGLETVTVNGTIQGCRYQAISGLRARYREFNAFSEAMARFNEITARTNLNPNPVQRGLGEDSTYISLNFTYEYSSDMRAPVSVEYSINFSYDFESDIASASISAVVKARSTYNSDTWAEVQRVADGVSLLGLLILPFSQYVSDVAPHLQSYPLNPTPENLSRSENQFALTITLGATYNNSPIPPVGLSELTTTVEITPSLEKYTAGPLLDKTGQYYIFDLGYSSRAEVSVKGEGRAAEDSTSSGALTALQTRLSALGAQYGAGGRMLLTAQNYTSGNIGVGVPMSASAAYSSEQTAFSL